MIHISWFVPGGRKWPWQRRYNYNKALASTWIRCLQLIPYLEESGVDSAVNTWSDHTRIAIFLRRWGVEDMALARKLKRRGVRIITDTPVNYFSLQDIPPFQGGVRDQFLSFADLSDAIFCPSLYTADFGRGQGYDVVCMEDSVDFRHFKYRKINPSLSRKPTLIWSGVSVKADVLNWLAPIILRNGWPVIIISDRKPDLDFAFTFIKWKYETFPGEIIKGDVGIFPRTTDNEYDMGHSFFKIGVFLAEHVPVIYAPVPSYQQVATQNNSIGITEPDEALWEQGIFDLAARQRESAFRRNLVEDFSTEKMATRYLAFFNRMLQS